MPTVVNLRRLTDLPNVLRVLGAEIERRTIASLRDTAQWGLARAQRVTQRQRISATRTFAQAWFAKDTNRGAVLGNSAMHATFVERGRKPGKPPPASVILEWARAKKLIRAKSERKNVKRRRIAIAYKNRMAFIYAVARKIGKKGTKGRYILRELMPRLQGHYLGDLKKKLRQLSANPPR